MDLWIAMYETTHTTMVSKNYAAFKASLLQFYPNLNHDTMKSAGYTAQAKEAQVQILETQVQKLTEQVKKLQGQKRPRAAQESRGKTKGTKYCDSCKFNHTHWSNECTKRKDEHNPNCMAPV